MHLIDDKMNSDFNTDWTRGYFDTLPAYKLDHGRLDNGYESLALKLRENIDKGLNVLVVDGYHGTDWPQFKSELSEELSKIEIHPDWSDVSECLLEPQNLNDLITPFLGGDDPIFGKLWPMGIEPFFDAVKIAGLRTEAAIRRGNTGSTPLIIVGCGASLVDYFDACWYIDVSKEQIQASFREGKLDNWGASGEAETFGSFYKRAYFVEWQALNRQKERLLPRLDLFIDLNDATNPIFISGDDFRLTLDDLSRTPFRPRPWFAPGPWGGQFMKNHMGLNPAEPNFAWSFELIAPENGVLISDKEHQLEFTFDYLLFRNSPAVMGAEASARYGNEWPVRFDYLDTIDGGNLSVQVHPAPDYIRREFGETFTQDETYYISKAQPGAQVYLGLTENADPVEFREALERSSNDGSEVDIDRFVNKYPAKDHDLFFIPNGTVHCSGRGNLVLEISATPYIYTFKLYDYLRRDLNGNLRTINIDRGFDNIRFDRKGDWVTDKLLSKPSILSEIEGCKELVLMDVPFMFYVIHRVDFDKQCEWDTDGLAYMVNLVEGDKVEVISENGKSSELAYLESMVVPASTGKVQFINKSEKPCKLVKVFVRPQK
jgi:mannose-6-phosphate isomerase class I